jgi:hypothetical protein
LAREVPDREEVMEKCSPNIAASGRYVRTKVRTPSSYSHLLALHHPHENMTV